MNATTQLDLTTCPIGPVAAVSDLPRARAFYEGVLGLRPGTEMGGDAVVMYPCGEGSQLVVYLSPQHAGKSTATLAGFMVGDVERAVADLTARGVTFEVYDEPKTDERGIMDAGSFKAAWFRDPDGNTYAINGS
jgi:catechol 2,3-dioxygenase-like lactoylglutathione lyase family enzyme